MSDATASPQIARARAAFARIPHCQHVGMQLTELMPGWGMMTLPYNPRLIGDPRSGVVHGGAITALLDACAGAAVFAALPQLQPIATLDLRIDYLRPAEPGRDVWAEATCHHMSKNVAFVRALAFHADGETPIATAAGTFMIATKLGTVAPRGGGA